MIDERPSNYIKDGKIYKLKKGKSYYSCGFYDSYPDSINEICDATDDAIAIYLENNDSLYDYDKCKYLDKSDIKPICEDKFGNKLNVPIDDFNHLMDAMRYALESFIKAKGWLS